MTALASVVVTTLASVVVAAVVASVVVVACVASVVVVVTAWAAVVSIGVTVNNLNDIALLVHFLVVHGVLNRLHHVVL